MTEKRIRWDKLNPTKEVHRGPTLSFTSLNRDDGGQYRCTQTILSPYLLSTRTEVQTKEIVVVG